MSLLNGKMVNKDVFFGGTRNQNFGQSMVSSMPRAAQVGTGFARNVKRKRALSAVERRDREVGTQNDFLNWLVNLNTQNYNDAYGNYDEAMLFDFIERYCHMEIAVYKLNNARGVKDEKVEKWLSEIHTNSLNFKKQARKCIMVTTYCLAELAKEGK